MLRQPLFALICSTLVFGTLSVPASADPCHVAAWERPAGCPRDDRVAALPADVRHNHVFFQRGGAELDADAQQQLILLAAALATDAFSGTCLRLVGHADSVGDPDKNMKLALARAKVVEQYLDQQLTSSDITFDTVSMGEIEPMAGIAADDSLQRRVAIWARACPRG